MLSLALCLVWGLTAPQVQAQAPRERLVLGLPLEPPNLDPTSGAAAAVDEVVYANVFEGLTRFGPNGSIEPGLAERWDVQDEGRTYVFHLRQGVTFHNGAAFDAGDVVFTLDRARAPDSTNAQKVLFQGIASVEAVDTATVRVTLTAPDGNFPFKMAWGDAVMLDPASADSLATNPVGTGPFRLEQWVQGDRIVLSAFDGYWGDRPALQTATFRFIPDPSAAFAAMMAGDVDAFPNFPAPETLPQLQADPRFKVMVGTTEGETILAMNNARAPLDDIRVRQAIAHAINRQDIVRSAFFGRGSPIHGAPLSPDSPYFSETAGKAFRHDPAQAKALLAKAGLPDGFSCNLLSTAQYGMHKDTGEVVQQNLATVGIQVQMNLPDWATRVQLGNRGQYDLAVNGTAVEIADPDGMMVSLIQSNYRGMGSGMAPPGLGFILQDRGEQFVLREDHPNGYAPGKRPFHTIIPAFATKDGEPWLSFGVMGGAMQPQGHVQILINMLDFGMNLQEAGDAPRIQHDGSTEPAGQNTAMTDGGEVDLETGFPYETVRALMQKGHSVRFAHGPYGGYQAIMKNPHGGWVGASESRKDGQAAGY